jgi:NADPH:quinone reductase-like Zn-dependent oxidoreductase
MRALLHDPDVPHGLRLGEAPDPDPRPSEALIEVGATSLNFADVAFLRRRFGPGDVPGFDAAGTVRVAAGHGSGPPAGTRVATFGASGGWAERRAVDTAEIAVVPDAVDLGAAAALPAAGVTALRALRRLGPLAGRRVLITGASGGVGRFAVQLAADAGAHVVAAVGSPGRAEGLARLGAAEVVVGLGAVGAPVDAALDNIGGQMLADAHALLRPGGLVLSVGMASLEPTTIDFEAARLRASGTRIETFVVGARTGEDLAHLVALLAAGRLDPQVGWRGPWDRAREAAAALLGRRVRGKAVLEVAS